MGILLQVEPDNRPSAEQVLTIPAMQPYTTAYVSRMCAGREAHSTPSPGLAGCEGQKGMDDKIQCDNRDEDKENVCSLFSKICSHP